jgi:hypothetical protein
MRKKKKMIDTKKTINKIGDFIEKNIPNVKVINKEYYILSLKLSKKRDKWFTFWRSNNSGYVWCIDNAGVYKEKEIMSEQAYYNNMESTLAIETYIVKEFAKNYNAKLDVEGLAIGINSKKFFKFIKEKCPDWKLKK